MAWPDHTDPVKLKAYRRAYYLAHKEHENRGRAVRKRKARARQIAYLKKNGLWPMIPEHRRYEIPPNLRELVLAQLIKRDPRSRYSPGSAQEEAGPQEVLHPDRGGERGEANP